MQADSEMTDTVHQQQGTTSSYDRHPSNQIPDLPSPPSPPWPCDPMWVMASSFLRFLDHTRRRTTVGRTPLDKRSARRRDLYLTHTQQTNIHAPGGIQTHDLSRYAAAHLHLRLRGHWDWQISKV
jgi:hypothetical protein